MALGIIYVAKKAAREFNLQRRFPYLISTIPKFKGADGTEHSKVEILASSLKVITEPLKIEE